MTEEQKNFFRSIGVTEEEIQYCYASEDGKLLALSKNENGKMLKTGKEIYKIYLDSLIPQPSTEETLSKEVANIKIDSMKKDIIITNALQTIANLKVEIMGLKGGNK